MTWIKTLSWDEAEGRLKKLFSQVRSPDSQIDNIMAAHSLRPHTLAGHMGIYKAVLHHPGNKLPTETLETLGVLVSHLNSCTYCVEHHFAGLQRLLGDDEKAKRIRTAIEADKLADALDAKTQAAAEYSSKLTLNAAGVTADDIQKLRESGFSDGEILEINQVVAYFAYANRTVMGLGINTDGEVLGLSPNDKADPDNWSHS